MDAEHIDKLTHALRLEGFSREAIARTMGLNILEFLERALPPRDL